ncbi:MAG: rRNA adenine dimethyltransferase family protein [bacterium]
MTSAPFGVEWAPGKGALTRHLTQYWDYILAVEIDQEFCRHLSREYSSQSVGVVRGDIQSIEMPVRPDAYPVVGNLPYHITGPLMMKILEISDRITQFQGLVQWEVARRLVEEPGGSDYGGLSLLYQWMGEVKVLHRVPSEAFTPRPNVDSGWIRYHPHRSPDDLKGVQNLVRTCFRHRRKTLLNNLAGEGNSKGGWKKWMEQQGWNVQRRPQTLKPSELEDLVKEWKRQKT